MVDWYSAFIVAAAGLTSVFLVLLLLLVSMKAVGAVLARMAPKETEKETLERFHHCCIPCRPVIPSDPRILLFTIAPCGTSKFL